MTWYSTKMNFLFLARVFSKHTTTMTHFHIHHFLRPMFGKITIHKLKSSQETKKKILCHKLNHCSIRQRPTQRKWSSIDLVEPKDSLHISKTFTVISSMDHFQETMRHVPSIQFRLTCPMTTYQPYKNTSVYAYPAPKNRNLITKSKNTQNGDKPWKISWKLYSKTKPGSLSLFSLESTSWDANGPTRLNTTKIATYINSRQNS